MKKKSAKPIIAVVGGSLTLVFIVVSLIAFGFFEQSIIDVKKDENNPLDDNFVSGLSLCEESLAETVQVLSSHGSTFAVVPECRRCEAQDIERPSSCHFGCGEQCPAGAQCSYPPDCETGGCRTSENTYCGGNPPQLCKTCHPTDRSYWESWARGCTPGYTQQAYATFVVESDEDLAAQETRFDSICDKDFTTCQPKTCEAGKIFDAASCSCKTDPEVPICELTCAEGEVVNHDKCMCVNAVNDPTNEFLGWGFGALSILTLAGTVFLLGRV